MSDDEPIRLRDLPAVEPVRAPSRFSQTLLRHEEDCPRSAFLYMKHRGGRPSREMDRGTLAHIVFEKLMIQLVATGEESYFTPGVHADEHGQLHDEGILEARRNVASLTSAVVNETVAEHPELVARPADWDDVREMAYHWALGYDVAPSSILGIERMMVLDVPLPDGTVWEVRGKIDVAYVVGDAEAGVDDYKTSHHVPSEAEYDESFQGRLYAILLCFGQPVDQVPCPHCPLASGVIVSDCETCGGRGYTEVRGERIGEWIQAVRTREVYPRRLYDDMTLPTVTNTLTRQALQDARVDLARLVERLAGRLQSWKFPAIHGTHCRRCPAKLECPLPAHLRDFAGTIDTDEQAREAAIKLAHDEDHIAARRAELRNHVVANGPIIMGDEEYVIVVSETRSVKRRGKTTDWEGFMDAVARAVEFGEPFDPDEWVKRRTSSNFKRRAIKPGDDNGGAG